MGGAIIVAASGVGKSWFVAHHPEWHDADELLAAEHSPAWYSDRHDLDDHQLYYEKCDQKLKALRDSGMKIVSSLFWELVPDAIVLLDEQLHRERVAMRPELEWAHVYSSVKFLEGHAKKYNVPVYSTLEEAALALATIQ